MSDKTVDDVRKLLKKKFETLDDKRSILRSKELRVLYGSIKKVELEKRAAFGASINGLKSELEEWVNNWEDNKLVSNKGPIDITAPFDENISPDKKPSLMGPQFGSTHPIVEEIDAMTSIFKRMGFSVVEARQLDDEYHMFDALNFPKDHPARDDYDTFKTEEGFILPAHTSTMQNRVFIADKPPIYTVMPGRTFRNEDIDATHEHTFHQVEGVVVDEGITLGDMLGTLKEFLSAYFEEEVEYRTQPFYFPFVEPGLEFLIKTPKQLQGTINDGWLEILGCGMIHPNVLKEGGINPERYSGFAWGGGVERMVMLKHGIEDIRHFMSGNLDFLKQFGGQS